MMYILTLILTISLFQASEDAECYYCVYDVIEQRLCLKNGDFTFVENAPLTDQTKISGQYIWNGDTLILNKGNFDSAGHRFKNEIKLVRKENRLHYMYEGNLSELSFER